MYHFGVKYVFSEFLLVPAAKEIIFLSQNLSGPLLNLQNLLVLGFKSLASVVTSLRNINASHVTNFKIEKMFLFFFTLYYILYHAKLLSLEACGVFSATWVSWLSYFGFWLNSISYISCGKQNCSKTLQIFGLAKICCQMLPVTWEQRLRMWYRELINILPLNTETFKKVLD